MTLDQCTNIISDRIL